MVDADPPWAVVGQDVLMQCCFCGTSIDHGLTAVIVSTRRSSDADADAPVQQVWFHPDCLRARLHPSVPFDVEAFND